MEGVGCTPLHCSSPSSVALFSGEVGCTPLRCPLPHVTSLLSCTVGGSVPIQSRKKEQIRSQSKQKQSEYSGRRCSEIVPNGTLWTGSDSSSESTRIVSASVLTGGSCSCMDARPSPARGSGTVVPGGSIHMSSTPSPTAASGAAFKSTSGPGNELTSSSSRARFAGLREKER